VEKLISGYRDTVLRELPCKLACITVGVKRTPLSIMMVIVGVALPGSLCLPNSCISDCPTRKPCELSVGKKAAKLQTVVSTIPITRLSAFMAPPFQLSCSRTSFAGKNMATPERAKFCDVGDKSERQRSQTSMQHEINSW